MGFTTAGAIHISGGSITGLARDAWEGGPMHDFWFDTGALTPVNRVVGPSGTGLFYSGDSVFTVASGAVTVTDYLWSYTVPPNRKDPPEDVYRRTSDSGVIIPATGSDSLWTYQASGTGMLILESSLGSRAATGIVSTFSGAQSPTYTFQHYAYDSLRYMATTGIDLRISGLSATAAKPIFSAQDHVTATYVRNTGCWAYNIDLTPISPWNSAGANYQAGTLVSPKHVMFAAHYAVPAGTTIRFVDSGNVVTTRTITGITTLPTYTSYYPDCTIGGLDSDVPAGISFATILPSTYTGYLPGGVSRIPTIATDYEEKALVTDLSTMTMGSGMYGAMVAYQVPIDSKRVQFYEDKIGGDSGNPSFIVVNGKLVLLNVWTFGGPGGGTNITYWKNDLNTIMTNLGGGYTLTEADLSAFATYT